MTSVRAIVDEIATIDRQLSALDLEPAEMRSMLYFLAGADPTTMRYAIRFLENQRQQGAWYTGWKSCPSSIKFNTPNQHADACTSCKES